MIIDFRTHASNYESAIIKRKAVDCVESYKYLGTVIDSKLGRIVRQCVKRHIIVFVSENCPIFTLIKL